MYTSASASGPSARYLVLYVQYVPVSVVVLYARTVLPGMAGDFRQPVVVPGRTYRTGRTRVVNWIRDVQKQSQTENQSDESAIQSGGSLGSDVPAETIVYYT